jgi:hypothetical protein
MPTHTSYRARMPANCKAVIQSYRDKFLNGPSANTRMRSAMRTVEKR